MPKINILSEKQDKELVELLTSGSQEACGELYARFKEWLMYLCKQFLKNEADAEDIVQDIFLKLWETRQSLGTVSSFSGLVKTMAQNYATSKLRHFDVHSRFAQNVLMNAKDLTNETEDTIINNDYEDFLDKIIERLPPKQQEIFRLHHIKGLTYIEIAEILQIPIENVRKNVSLALKKIKKQVVEHTDINIQTVILIFVLLSVAF